MRWYVAAWLLFFHRRLVWIRQFSRIIHTTEPELIIIDNNKHTANNTGNHKPISCLHHTSTSPVLLSCYRNSNATTTTKTIQAERALASRPDNFELVRMPSQAEPVAARSLGCSLVYILISLAIINHIRCRQVAAATNSPASSASNNNDNTNSNPQAKCTHSNSTASQMPIVSELQPDRYGVGELHRPGSSLAPAALPNPAVAKTNVTATNTTTSTITSQPTAESSNTNGTPPQTANQISAVVPPSYNSSATHYRTIEVNATKTGTQLAASGGPDEPLELMTGSDSVPSVVVSEIVLAEDDPLPESLLLAGGGEPATPAPKSSQPPFRSKNLLLQAAMRNSSLLSQLAFGRPPVAKQAQVLGPLSTTRRPALSTKSRKFLQVIKDKRKSAAAHKLATAANDSSRAGGGGGAVGSNKSGRAEPKPTSTNRQPATPATSTTTRPPPSPPIKYWQLDGLSTTTTPSPTTTDPFILDHSQPKLGNLSESASYRHTNWIHYVDEGQEAGGSGAEFDDEAGDGNDDQLTGAGVELRAQTTIADGPPPPQQQIALATEEREDHQGGGPNPGGGSGPMKLIFKSKERTHTSEPGGKPVRSKSSTTIVEDGKGRRTVYRHPIDSAAATGQQQDNKLPIRLRERIIEQFLKNGGDPSNIVVSDSTITTTTQSKRKTITTVYKIVPSAGGKPNSKHHHHQHSHYSAKPVPGDKWRPYYSTTAGQDGGQPQGWNDPDNGDGHELGPAAPYKRKNRNGARQEPRTKGKKLKRIMVTRIEVPQEEQPQEHENAHQKGDGDDESEHDQPHAHDEEKDGASKPSLGPPSKARQHHQDLGEFYSGPHATIFGMDKHGGAQFSKARRQRLFDIDKTVATHPFGPPAGGDGGKSYKSSEAGKSGGDEADERDAKLAKKLSELKHPELPMVVPPAGDKRDHSQRFASSKSGAEDKADDWRKRFNLKLKKSPSSESNDRAPDEARASGDGNSAPDRMQQQQHHQMQQKQQKQQNQQQQQQQQQNNKSPQEGNEQEEDEGDGEEEQGQKDTTSDDDEGGKTDSGSTANGKTIQNSNGEQAKVDADNERRPQKANQNVKDANEGQAPGSSERVLGGGQQTSAGKRTSENSNSSKKKSSSSVTKVIVDEDGGEQPSLGGDEPKRLASKRLPPVGAPAIKTHSSQRRPSIAATTTTTTTSSTTTTTTTTTSTTPRPKSATGARQTPVHRARKIAADLMAANNTRVAVADSRPNQSAEVARDVAHERSREGQGTRGMGWSGARLAKSATNSSQAGGGHSPPDRVVEQQRDNTVREPVTKTHNIMMLIDFGQPPASLVQGPIVVPGAAELNGFGPIESGQRQGLGPASDGGRIGKSESQQRPRSEQTNTDQWRPLSRPHVRPEPAGAAANQRHGVDGSRHDDAKREAAANRQQTPTINVQIYNSLAHDQLQGSRQQQRQQQARLNELDAAKTAEAKSILAEKGLAIAEEPGQSFGPGRVQMFGLASNQHQHHQDEEQRQQALFNAEQQFGPPAGRQHQDAHGLDMFDELASSSSSERRHQGLNASPVVALGDPFSFGPAPMFPTGGEQRTPLAFHNRPLGSVEPARPPAPLMLLPPMAAQNTRRHPGNRLQQLNNGTGHSAINSIQDQLRAAGATGAPTAELPLDPAVPFMFASRQQSADSNRLSQSEQTAGGSLSSGDQHFKQQQRAGQPVFLSGESAQTNQMLQRVIDEISKSALASGFKVADGEPDDGQSRSPAEAGPDELLDAGGQYRHFDQSAAGSLRSERTRPASSAGLPGNDRHHYDHEATRLATEREQLAAGGQPAELLMADESTLDGASYHEDV
jgi:hypothetical protein